jgi:Tfp pilus assembly protein PilF
MLNAVLVLVDCDEPDGHAFSGTCACPSRHPQVWGERFDFEMEDVFSVQDEIVDAIISHLAFNLDDVAGAKRQKDPTTSETAYTYFLKARSLWRAGKETEAMRLAQKAVEADPNYGRAHAYVAYFYGYSLFSQHLGLGPDETQAYAEMALDRALACDPNDPFILQKLSMTKIMLGQPTDALRLSRSALRFGARDGEIIINHGHSLIVCGAYEEGTAYMEQAMALVQRSAVPPGFYCGLGECRHICRDYSGSVAALDMMSDPPYDILLLKAAGLARLGEVDAARRVIDSAPAGFCTTRHAQHMARTCALPEDIAHFRESFRLAGVKM